MFNRFDHSSSSDPHRIRRVSGSPNSKRLFDDALLEELLAQLENMSVDASYPLQISFYEHLLKCDLLLPVPVDTSLKHGFPLIMLENSRGEKGLPLFTNERNLASWVEEATDYVIMPFVTLCGYAMEAQLDYIIVNVAGPYGCEISFTDFSYLSEGLLPPPSPHQAGDGRLKSGEVTIEKNTPMRLGLNAGLPTGLMDRLNHVFEYHRHLINQVYLFDVAFNNGPLQPALGIRMPDGSECQWEQDLWPTLQAVLHEMLEKRSVINVFLLNEAGSMETHVSKLTSPIYTGVSD